MKDEPIIKRRVIWHRVRLEERLSNEARIVFKKAFEESIVERIPKPMTLVPFICLLRTLQ